ncbi:LysM peptidoglycan-binding domain-containing protein [Sporolactobacillus sp. STCC-11]|uniref:LysM peptidoglycan-binding domain-containing protein n=1 Tax=Sporolactobacillus caesalpiniae TaxID=3230362 RepID=UPI0033967170
MKLYVVQKGDTLEEIASKHGMTIDEFRKMNTNLTEETLSQGMKVKVAIGKQPLKRAIPVSERSEGHHQAPAQPAPIQQAPTQQAPVQQAPEPVQQPTPSAPAPVTEKQPNTSAGTQLAGESTAEFPKILYPKQPETAGWNPNEIGIDPSFSFPQSQGNVGTQVSPATQGGGTIPYYPPMGNMGNVVSPAWQGPNSGNVVSPAWQGPNSGNVVSPAWQGPNSGNVVSPAWQGPNSGNVVSPAAQGPNMGNVVSPAAQGPNMGNVVSPAAQGPNMGNVVSPAAQGPNMGNVMSPATEGQGIKPFYPNPKFGGASSQKKPMYPFHPSEQMGQMSPYYPQLQPWNGKQPQYPISHGTVQLDQPFKGKSAGGKSPLPWSNPQVAGASTKPKAIQSAPSKANIGKLSPAGSESTGAYPYPYMPTKAQTGKPCNCGGPAPFPAYGQMPVAGYYGGNQPPRPQPMPYWAMSNVSAPIYQSHEKAGQQNNKKSK